MTFNALVYSSDASLTVFGINGSTSLYDSKTEDQVISSTVDTLVGAHIVPVPEPESYAMMLAGLGLVGAVAKRRKSKQS